MKDRETKQVGSPGKYQDISERLVKDLKADAVILIVVGGRKVLLLRFTLGLAALLGLVVLLVTGCP